MKGIVSSVKHSEASGDLYFVATFDRDFKCVEFKGNVELHPGELLDMEEMSVTEPEESIRQKKLMYSALQDRIEKAMRKKVYEKGVDGLDKTTNAMWKTLESASKLFLKKLMLGAPIIVRFHNDADGSGGAYSLYLGLKDLGKSGKFPQNIVWIMNRGVAYSRFDAQNDILTANNYSSLEKPLLVIIDFGTSIESNPGIAEVDEKFDVIWLDHHPMASGFRGTELEHYINPWNFGGDSNYTAGFLASAFTKTFSAADTSEYENASFIGDYSEYADVEGKGSNASTIFDLVTSDLTVAFGANKSNVTPQEFEGIFKDREKTADLLRYANVRLNEVLDSGIESLKTYKANGFEIFLLDFEDIRSEESKYPLPGRFASKLLTRINESGRRKVMVIVHVGAYLLMRLDRALGDEMNLLDIIESMKEKYGDSIEGGGGHRRAGAIKLRDKSNKRNMINDIIKSLK